MCVCEKECVTVRECVCECVGWIECVCVCLNVCVCVCVRSGQKCWAEGVKMK